MYYTGKTVFVLTPHVTFPYFPVEYVGVAKEVYNLNILKYDGNQSHMLKVIYDLLITNV